MVPVASKQSSKQKPPTPPKPVQFQPRNAYERLIETKYASTLLEIVDHNKYNSGLHRSLNDSSSNDDTAPLIDEEPEGRAVNAVAKPLIKPPLLPKPQHIPTKSTSLLIDLDSPNRSRPKPPSREAKTNQNSYNPFKSDENSDDRSHNPFENVKTSLNPFKSDHIKADTQSSVNIVEYLTSTSLVQNQIRRRTKASTLSRVDDLKNICQKEFSGETKTESESKFLAFSRTVDFSKNSHSLEEIHIQFETDTESLLEKDYSSTRGSLLKKRVDLKNVDSGIDSSLSAENDKSNRSSWRSNSDLESAEFRSRSSSVTEENECWRKSRESSGSSVKQNDSNVEEDDDKGENLDDDDESVGNGSTENYSVRRRIKTWFGSFGKGGKSSKRRDSVFYVEPNNKTSMWESASVSSGEEKNGNDDAVESSKDETVNGVLNGNDQNSVEREPESESEKEAKREKKAYYVINELINSEKVFIDVLRLLTDDFINYVRSVDRVNPIIPESELNKIINYLPQLRSFNEDLLKDFESRLDNWDLFPKIADIIIKKGPFLKLFSTYIQNFEKQCNFLDECCQKHHRFSKALKEFESSDRCKKLTLKHYMLKPIQRLPQYRLLLEDYLSHQTPGSLDYSDTKLALQTVCDAADHANKSIKSCDQFSKLLVIQDRTGYEVIKPGREFVKEGQLYKLSRKELHLRDFILLNDCLLYTSYGSMFNLMVKELPLAGMKVCIPSVEDYHNEFSIIGTTRSFTLRANSPEEREEWVSVLEQTIQEYNKKKLSFSPKFEPTGVIGKKAPIWIPDHRVTMCQICTAEFTITFRRHHCRACGRVVCGNCSDNKAPMQYMNFQADRVCNKCYDYLYQEYKESPSSIIEFFTVQMELNESEAAVHYQNLKSLFKKHDPHNSKKLRKYVPPRLKEVTANDSGSQISGWLHRKNKSKSWKRYWFVLKKAVLYVYKASEDVMALESKPVLGYVVETFKEASSSYEDIDSKLVFQLSHAGQPPLVFYAENETLAERWITTLREATSLPT